MPVYEYEVCAGPTGEIVGTITLPLPVETRDQVQLRRCPVPRTLSVLGAAVDPSLPAHQVLGAYRRMEQRLGSNAEFRRRIGHSPEVVKQAWSTPG